MSHSSPAPAAQSRPNSTTTTHTTTTTTTSSTVSHIPRGTTQVLHPSSHDPARADRMSGAVGAPALGEPSPQSQSHQPQHPMDIAQSCSSSKFDYAQLRLQPATRTSVVTTTTVTTVEFAPILVPKSRKIKRAPASFPAPAIQAWDADRPQASTSSIAGGLRALVASEEAPLELDGKLYPLSGAKWPTNLNSFKFALGELDGRFDAGEQTEDSGMSHSSFGGSAKGKESAESVNERGQGAFPSPSREGDEAAAISHSRRRARRSSGEDSLSLEGDIEPEHPIKTEDGTVEMVTSPADGRLSPGPPRKRARPRSTEPHQQPIVDSILDRRGLPSPGMSPPSPVPTLNGGGLDSDDDDTANLTRTTNMDPSLEIGQSGLGLSSLLSLPDMVSSFDQLSPQLQSYILFSLLRRAPVQVLQNVNNLVGPALRRDFLCDLPIELGLHVLSFLDGESLCRAAGVSRSWRGLVDGEWRVWKDRLVADGLWVGDGSEEREAKQIASRSSESVFLKRFKAGVWSASGPAVVEEEPMHIDGVDPASPRRYSIAQGIELASPTSSRQPSVQPEPGLSEHCSHPFKTLWLRRSRSQFNWRHKEPVRTTFARHVSNTAGGVVTCLQFDKEKIVTASDEHSISVFDTRTGATKARLNGHEGGVWALQYIGNILVSGSTDRTVRVWDLNTNKCTHTFVGHTSTVRCLQILEPVNINLDPKGEPVWEPPYPLIVTGSRDWHLRVWRLPLPAVDDDYHPAVPLSASDDATSTEGNPFHERLLKGHKQAVRALAAHGRTIVSGSYDCRVIVWDAITGERKHTLTGHDQKVYSVVYDPSRQQCASGSMDGTVKLWSTTEGTCLATLDGHSSLVGLLGLSTRHLVSAAADSTLRIWDPATGEHRHTLAAHAGAITCFDHDNWKVVSGSDGTLKMWDVQQGKMERDLITGLGGVWQVAFDQRFCVAAVQRNGQSEFEILDFGPTSWQEAEQDRIEAQQRKDEVLTLGTDDDEEELEVIDTVGARGDSIPIQGGSRPIRSGTRPPGALLRAAEFPRQPSSGPSSAHQRAVRRTSSWRNLHPLPAQAPGTSRSAATATGSHSTGGSGSHSTMTTPVGSAPPPPASVRPRLAQATHIVRRYVDETSTADGTPVMITGGEVDGEPEEHETTMEVVEDEQSRAEEE